MTVKLKNNVASTLRTEILSTDTAINLPVGHGARFPALGAGDYFYATIEDAAGNSEIVQATARAGDALTVVRGAEGATPRTFAAGSTIEMRVTAASVLDAAQDAADAVDLAQFGVTASASEINLLDGVTWPLASYNSLLATAAELNILDGVTASAAELNILDGVTASAAELNLLDGSVAATVVNDRAAVYGAAGELLATTFSAADGARATPSITFTNDTDTGFYRVGANRIGVSTGNDLIANFEGAGDGVLNVGDQSSRSNIRVSASSSNRPRLQVEGTGINTAASIIRNSATVTSSAPYFTLGRSRGTDDGQNTVLIDNDDLGYFNFVGADGTNLILGAQIIARVEGTPGTGSMPCEMSFRTSAAGSADPTERFTLTSNGRLRLFTTGVTALADDDGTLTTGTYTPTPLGGNFKRLINGGAFTLAAPTASEDYTLIIQVTNNATAGAITLSGFSKTGGDSFTTTSGHDFFIFITKCNGFTSATVQALQ